MDASETESSRRVEGWGFPLLLGLLVMVAVGKVVLADSMDPDAFWHLCVGERLERNGVGPLVDDLSFASELWAWTPYSWLAELGMKKLWDAGGYRAAVAAQAGMEGAFVLLIGLGCLEATWKAWGRKRYMASAMGAAAGEIFSLAYLSFRPVTMALVMLALAAWLLLRDRRMRGKSWMVWGVPVIAAVTINIHFYAWIIPLWTLALVVGDWMEGKRVPGRGMLLLVLTAMGSMATPLLGGTLAAVFRYGVSDPMVHSRALAEMVPFYNGWMGRVSAGIVGVLVIGVVWRWKRIGWGELLWLLGSGVMLCGLGRLATVFALIGGPMLAVTLPALSDRMLGRLWLTGVMLIVLTAGMMNIVQDFPGREEPLSIWLNRHGAGFACFPCGAADFVDERVQRQSGRLICEFPWGGYLEWRLEGRYQTLMDGRTQVFSDAFWESTYLGTDVDRERVVKMSGADAAVLPADGDASLFRDTLKRMGWKKVYGDAFATVMVPG